MHHKAGTLAIVSMFLAVSAESQENIRDFDPLFDSHDVLEAEVVGPFQFLERERPDDEEAEGTFRILESDGTYKEFDIQIRARGNYRRNPAVCSFPPMRLNFKKSQTADTLLDKQDKLKLVTHCQNSDDYQQTVISEYLAYRIFNMLTDFSFRARLVNMTYIYTDRSLTRQSLAMFIEHEDRLGKRIGAEPLEVSRANVVDLDADALNLVSVFEYFIGNTDFSPVAGPEDQNCCHNQTLFARENGFHLPVPYDFDQSGFVDADHAAPNPRFGLRNVKQRLYRGRCINNNHLEETLDLFRAKRADIVAIVEGQPELSKARRRSILNYIDDFYELIDKPKQVEKRLIRKCLPP